MNDKLKLAFQIGFYKESGEEYDSCVEQVKSQKGKSESDAHAICNERMNKNSFDEGYEYIKTKIREDFDDEGEKKEAQLSPEQREALRRRIALRRRMQAAQQGGENMVEEITEHPSLDEAFRGAGIGGAAGLGTGYFTGKPFKKGILGAGIGGATLATDYFL